MSVNTYLAPSPVIPQFLLISNITRSFPMVVTVTETNNYVVGQLVYFSVPNDYGMFQVNGLTGKITRISGLDFYVEIDSSGFDIFVNPPSGNEKPASLSPAGSRNIYNTQYAPFHSEGNTGN